MKFIILWVIAISLAIPTYSVSLIVALFISLHYIKERKELARKTERWTTSTLNKYHAFRKLQELETSKLSSEDIIKHVIKYFYIIEEFLKKNSLDNSKKNEILLLAVRLASYEEEAEPEDLERYVENDLNLILGYQSEDEDGNDIINEGIMCAYNFQYEPYWTNQDRLETIKLERLINRANRLFDDIKKVEK